MIVLRLWTVSSFHYWGAHQKECACVKTLIANLLTSGQQRTAHVRNDYVDGTMFVANGGNRRQQTIIASSQEEP